LQHAVHPNSRLFTNLERPEGEGSSSYLQIDHQRPSTFPPTVQFVRTDCSLSFLPIAIRLLVVYRPPASSHSVFRDEFSSLLEQIALNKLLIVGDFNLSISETSLTMRHNDYSTAPKPSVSRSSSHQRPTKAAQFSTLFSLGRLTTSCVAQVFLAFSATTDQCLSHCPADHHAFHLCRSLSGGSATSTQKLSSTTSNV
jgi:hypothetical protein